MESNIFTTSFKLNRCLNHVYCLIRNAYYAIGRPLISKSKLYSDQNLEQCSTGNLEIVFFILEQCSIIYRTNERDLNILFY